MQHRARTTDDAAEVRLMACPTCGNGEHVEIGQTLERSRTEWAARCTECGTEWRFTDA